VTATVARHAGAIRARKAGFFADVVSVAGRAVRSILREPESVIPALIVPVFFFVVNIGSLQDVAERFGPGFDFKAFQLPVAIVFAVTGISRASVLVTDIQDGYFDRLSLTPIRRPALLLGLMVADFVLVVALAIPVVMLGFAVGVRFETGPLGVLAFIFMAGAWGLVFTGFPYAIALKTGNPAAVNTSFPLLPVRVPHHRVRAQGGPDRVALGRGHLQPGHLPPRRPPLPGDRGLGGDHPPEGAGRGRRRRRGELLGVHGRLPGPHPRRGLSCPPTIRFADGWRVRPRRAGPGRSGPR